MLRFDNNGKLVTTKISFPARDSDFDVRIRPSVANSDTTSEYFSTTRPNTNCNICHRSAKDCLTHRVGMKIPFIFINPTMSHILQNILKRVCLIYDDKNKIFNGCGHYRSENKTIQCPGCYKQETMDYMTASRIYKEIRNNVELYRDNMHKMSTICYKDKEGHLVGIDLRKFVEFSKRIGETTNWRKAALELGLSEDLRLADFVTNTVAVLPSQLRSFSFTVDTNQAFTTMFEKIREINITIGDDALVDLNQLKLENTRNANGAIQKNSHVEAYSNLEPLIELFAKHFVRSEDVIPPSNRDVPLAIGKHTFTFEILQPYLNSYIAIDTFFMKNIVVLFTQMAKNSKLMWSLSIHPGLDEWIKLRLYEIWRAVTGNQQTTSSDINHTLLFMIENSEENNGSMTTNYYGLAHQVYEEILKVMPPTYAKSDAMNKDNSTLFMMLPDKTGLYRDTILAKQTTNCARTVVGPSDERFGDFEIPYYYITLQVIEDVNKLTIDYVKDLAKAGMVRYIHKAGGDKYLLYNEKETPIEKGDKVYRAILPGDPIIMNRQPTLHQHSVMAHHVQFTRDPVVRLHPMCTKSYAADFDGDEMNTFVAMSMEAQLELMMFLHCNHMIISGNKPLIGPMFHELACLYHMSRKADVVIPHDLFAYYVSILAVFDYENAILHRLRAMNKNTKYFSVNLDGPGQQPMASTNQISLATNVYKSVHTKGVHLTDDINEQIYDNCTNNTYRKIISLLFPEDFTYKNDVIDGVFVGNTLDDSNISIGRGHIVHVIHHRYGYKTCARFLTYITHICSAVMRNAYISMKLDYFGLGQDKVDFAKIKETITDIKEKINVLQKKQDDEPSLLKRTMIEDSIKNLAGSYQSKIQKSVKDRIDPDDGFSVLIASGARGNFTALQQISMSVGQQYDGSKRVNASSLPYVKKLDDHALKHGFLIGNFNDGMSPVEMMIHSVPVRSSIIKAKMEVKDVGDMANRIASCLGCITMHDDLSLHINDLRVSNTMGGHMDPAKLTQKKLRTGETIMTFIDVDQDLF